MARAAGLVITERMNEPEMWLACSRVLEDLDRQEKKVQTVFNSWEERWSLITMASRDSHGTVSQQVAALRTEEEQMAYVRRIGVELDEKMRAAQPLTPGVVVQIVNRGDRSYKTTIVVACQVSIFSACLQTLVSMRYHSLSLMSAGCSAQCSTLRGS